MKAPPQINGDKLTGQQTAVWVEKFVPNKKTTHKFSASG